MTPSSSMSGLYTTPPSTPSSTRRSALRSTSHSPSPSTGTRSETCSHPSSPSRPLPSRPSDFPELSIRTSSLSSPSALSSRAHPPSSFSRSTSPSPKQHKSRSRSVSIEAAVDRSSLSSSPLTSLSTPSSLSSRSGGQRSKSGDFMSLRGHAGSSRASMHAETTGQREELLWAEVSLAR